MIKVKVKYLNNSIEIEFPIVILDTNEGESIVRGVM